MVEVDIMREAENCIRDDEEKSADRLDYDNRALDLAEKQLEFETARESRLAVTDRERLDLDGKQLELETARESRLAVTAFKQSDLDDKKLVLELARQPRLQEAHDLKRAQSSVTADLARVDDIRKIMEPEWALFSEWKRSTGKCKNDKGD